MKKIKLSCRGFLVFLSVLVAFTNSTKFVFALSNQSLDVFSQNNILFYDPEYGCQADGMYTSKPSGDQITWIGDSYSVGAESKIEAKLPGVDLGGVGLPRNIQSGKRFGYDISGGTAFTDYTNHRLDSDNPSGLTILDNLAKNNKLRKYIVFALGTNDGGVASENMEELVDEMINVGGNDHTYILMTPRIYNSTYESVIDGIRSAANKHDNIIIADWESAVSQDLNKYFTPSIDRIHPNLEGYDLFVDTIYNALPGGSVGILGGNTNEEKVWNYLATAAISGVSDNAAAIAGIIGNFKQETGVNPFTHDSGSQYYGIYQTNDQNMINDINDAGLSQYWGSNSAPQDAVDRAIAIELDYLTKKNPRFVSDGYAFLKNLGKAANTPEGYSDLFLVAVEGAVTTNTVSPYTHDSNYIEDAGARSVGTAWFSGADGGGQYYQEAGTRRKYAREVFNNYSSASSQTIIRSQTNSGGSFVWENGWLTSGMPGLVKEDVTSYTLNERLRDEYGTTDGKPNKILLHNTEGTSNGFGAYGDNKFPAHFIIDLKKKEAYQNLPINIPALATVSADDSTIQIEIVGFSTTESSPYYLQKFTANEWDYLAVLLAAISQETGIPLTTSVNWDDSQGDVRVADREYFRNNVYGIVGHMHSPPGDDHGDPGNIWSFVEAAIARNPDAARFGGNANYNGCSEYGGTNSNIGNQGLTYEQAKRFAVNYGTNKNNSSSEQVPIIWNYCGGGGSNCTTLSGFFINKFSDFFVGDATGDGWEVVGRLRAQGAQTGKEPKVWSVFSWPDGSTGHTGLVVGYENGEWIVVQASCGRGKRGLHGPGDGTTSGGGSAVVTKSSNIGEAVWNSYGLEFAYLEDRIDMTAISRYLSTGE